MSNEITIVVPAYNAERVLPRCLESLLAQIKLPQIIIANDGSVDRTAEIADAAAAQFPAVHVIHMSHGGVNVTRKKAAQAVETPYFAFLDADDRLDSLFVEKMMSAAVGQKADIVYCSYRCLYDGVERHVSYGGDATDLLEREYPVQDNPQLLLSIPTFFWGKVYRTKFFHAVIQFAPDDCVLLEDVPAIVPLLIQTPRLAKVNEPLYRYTISTHSASRVSKQELTRLIALRILHQRLNDSGAMPKFLPQLYALNRCYLYDQLEKLTHYCDPPHQHQVVREYFKHLDETLPRWRPHPFHPTFYAAYWHLMVTLNALKARGVQIRDRWRAWFRRQHRGNRPTPKA